MKTKIDTYLHKLDRSRNTIETYTWALNYFYGLVDDAPLDMETYEIFLSEIKHLSPSTKRVLVSAVSGLYDFYDAGNPIQMQKLNKIYTRSVRPNAVNFDREAIEKILAYCDSLTGNLIELRDRAFFITLADSGLRISELANLRRGDIDWHEQRVIVKGKRDKVAMVRLSGRSIEALQDYLKARQKMDGETGKPLDTLPLFAQHGNINRVKAITTSGIRKSLKECMMAVGVNVRIHDFRHYFVTVVLLTTDNLKLAQELARHESATTTQRYAHLANAELDRKYDEIFNQR